MKMNRKVNRCLYCYLPLAAEEVDFHVACSEVFFGTKIPPELPYSESQLEELGMLVVKNRLAITGVQPKMSLTIAAGLNGDQRTRFTIVGLWGNYILKPPVTRYPQLPEIEHLTMQLAKLANIATVPNSLIRLKSGNLAYITRRVD